LATKGHNARGTMRSRKQALPAVSQSGSVQGENTGVNPDERRQDEGHQSGSLEQPRQYPTDELFSAAYNGEQSPALRKRSFVSEDEFLRFLCLERKRSERSGKPFLVMLVEGGALFAAGGRDRVPARIAEALLSSTRDTDLVGWYKSGSIMGVLCTEIADELSVAMNVLLAKFTSLVGKLIPAEQESHVKISMHVFPEPPNGDSGRKADLTFYPDVTRSMQSDATNSGLKRAIDLLGSVIALVLLSPVILLVAVAVKLTSKGPVLIRQTRVGQYGRNFTLLKFRSMYADCDHNIHKAYVSRFIAGAADVIHTDDNGKGVYKLTKDPRVTLFGRFLRKTSLDEVPQFFNVLRGEMSLVGPRPAMPYEVDRYETWHRRRMLAAKPGITGLWQVHGRSRTSFDEMVRLDLKYVETASLALDLKIILQTPRAVFFGAY
jgi:lipopolysaccharide/colanic/teichoic acid biosynthesis glycosyltransferase